MTPVIGMFVYFLRQASEIEDQFPTLEHFVLLNEHVDKNFLVFNSTKVKSPFSDK